MDRYLCFQAFVRVAETQSFADAAKQLDITPSVITNRIAQLETFINAPLFHRSTRKVSLSEAGENFLVVCSEALAQMDEITEQMKLTHSTLTGVLRVHVLPGFALGHLGSKLKIFTDKYPDINLDITVSDSTVNPVDAGFDISLQPFRPGAETLIERRLFSIKRVFCAADSYLSQHPALKTPLDLKAHTIGLYSAYPTRNRWVFLYKNKEIKMDLPSNVRSNSVHMLCDFTLSGGGISCLPSMVCYEHLASGKLKQVLPQYKISPLELFAIYPVTHRRAVKVNLFVDFIAEHFSDNSRWGELINQGGSSS